MVNIVSDEERQADSLVMQGIELFEEGQHTEAHALFEKAFNLASQSARAQAWYGLTLGIEEKKVQKGIGYCKQALESGLPDAMFYRNIALLFLEQKNRRSAVGALAKGLQIEKDNRAIWTLWRKIGLRRKVPLPFLSREHWLNRWLGKLSWKYFN